MKSAARICLFFMIITLLVAVESVGAREIAGVNVPESITVDNKVLVLNGAGIRKKFFMKIYVGALYLTVKRSTADDILADPGAKSIVMHFLYKEVSAERMVKGWNDGFADNNSAEERKVMQDRINQFNSFFPAVQRGDVIKFEYLPQEGTRVWINDTLKGSVAGEDFARALLKIWLGPEPAEESLKEAMLGR